MSADLHDEPMSFRSIWQVYRVPIIFGLFSLLFIALSVTIFIKSYQETTPITFSSDQHQASSSGSLPASEMSILVDIEGAVVRPGVYRLAQGARADDVIGAAGGFTIDADRESVARLINRAAKLIDGSKLYIPTVQDNAADGSGLTHTGIAATTVNINTASQSELEGLAGVGPVTANKIIGSRPYTRIEELVERKTMSQSVFDSVKHQLGL